MHRDPDLPVRLLPVAESREADALLNSGEASGALAMTYIAAKKRMTGAVPSLRLHSVFLWRGFFQVASEQVSSFADLRGQTVIVSGPVGLGRGGGGDIIFQAAVRRQGLDPTLDLNVEYAPAAEGSARVASGTAAAITLPSPGSTGLVMRSRIAQRPIAAAMARMRGIAVGDSVPLAARIDFQEVFPGFPTFPSRQLPLGGLCVTERALAAPDHRAKIEAIARAYGEAARLFMRDPGTVAGAVSDLFSHYYEPLGTGGPPGELLSRSISGGDLVYRADIPIRSVQNDLAAWLQELIGLAVEPAFFEHG
jgi:ABC-type nitrate/sulfonate/bicarbonate transport system substrate-binding protein